MNQKHFVALIVAVLFGIELVTIVLGAPVFVQVFSACSVVGVVFYLLFFKFDLLAVCGKLKGAKTVVEGKTVKQADVVEESDFERQWRRMVRIAKNA